ncbi:hypothetical protein Q8G37_25600 [Bacillus wiedmannii]|uniref:hypothetical protein n=1 Tax=Bacillus wiedmannii TaxID=1890302 RepID=UPI0027309982|nr:hypothetical protein [Bacillus wiedmannii]MDP1459776.1 hypothetical protein [Bacillus wiedmannii]
MKYINVSISTGLTILSYILFHIYPEITLNFSTRNQGFIGIALSIGAIIFSSFSIYKNEKWRGLVYINICYSVFTLLVMILLLGH